MSFTAIFLIFPSYEWNNTPLQIRKGVFTKCQESES